MKRRWIALIWALCLLVSITGCGGRLPQLFPSEGDAGRGQVQEETTEITPDTETASVPEETAEDSIYKTLYAAIDSGEAACRVNGASGDAVSAAMEQLYQQPAFFWLNGCQLDAYTVAGAPVYVEVTFRFCYDNISARRAELEERVDAILADMPVNGTDYHKARAVHDYLITHITYGTGSGAGQDIYAALVEGSCVCQGYASAYAYLLGRLGVSCDVIAGTGDEESHAWNHVVLNGLDYYTDVTWDDMDRRSAGGSEYVTYHWFNLTLEDMAARHTAAEGTALPPADTTDYNYYTMEQAWLWQYSVGGVEEALAGQVGNGTGLLTLRCRSEDCYQAALTGLIDRQEIYQVLRDLGYDRNQITYFQEDSLYILTIAVA